MTDVSVFGLGSMGSGLGRALLDGGNAVCVWNRSPDKTRPLEGLGAAPAGSSAEAARASPLLLVCLNTYESLQKLLDDESFARALAGRAVVNMTTGTPDEARRAEGRVKALGAEYLDGAILGGVHSLGTSRVTLGYAGSRRAFDRFRLLLLTLGPNTRFVSEDVGAAAALDLAWLAKVGGTLVGLAFGAAICDREGVPVSDLQGLFPGEALAERFLGVVADPRLGACWGSVDIWRDAMAAVMEHACRAGLDATFPAALAAVMDRARALGRGDEPLAVLSSCLGASGVRLEARADP